MNLFNKNLIYSNYSYPLVFFHLFFSFLLFASASRESGAEVLQMAGEILSLSAPEGHFEAQSDPSFHVLAPEVVELVIP